MFLLLADKFLKTATKESLNYHCHKRKRMVYWPMDELKLNQ